MPRWARRTLIILLSISVLLLGAVFITWSTAAAGVQSSAPIFGAILGALLVPPITVSWDRWGRD